MPIRTITAGTTGTGISNRALVGPPLQRPNAKDAKDAKDAKKTL